MYSQNQFKFENKSYSSHGGQY